MPESWFVALEKRFGKLAIPGLIRYLILLNALVFVLILMNPAFPTLISLDPGKILQGQVWRLFSWIFIPPTTSLIWILFALLFLWTLGEGLERAWGPFRFTLFYALGWFLCTASGLAFGSGWASVFLNVTLLFAFATIYPDTVFYLFLILPVKVKWIAWLTFAILVVPMFITLPLGQKGIILASMANYVLFFGPTAIRGLKTRAEVAQRRQKFESAKMQEYTLHRCVTCGRTEISDPTLDFRVSKDGEEYCVEHLPSRQK